MSVSDQRKIDMPSTFITPVVSCMCSLEDLPKLITQEIVDGGGCRTGLRFRWYNKGPDGVVGSQLESREARDQAEIAAEMDVDRADGEEPAEGRAVSGANPSLAHNLLGTPPNLSILGSQQCSMNQLPPVFKYSLAHNVTLTSSTCLPEHSELDLITLGPEVFKTDKYKEGYAVELKLLSYTPVEGAIWMGADKFRMKFLRSMPTTDVINDAKKT